MTISSSTEVGSISFQDISMWIHILNNFTQAGVGVGDDLANAFLKVFWDF